jgi:biotin-(acetyl-CoA carboxylase) ligase
MDADELAEFSQPATSLVQMAASEIDRTQVLMNTIDSVIDSIRAFESDAVQDLVREFERFDAFHGCPVEVVTADNRIAGINRGITADGHLQLETEHGIEVHSAAEISLRVASE